MEKMMKTAKGLDIFARVLFWLLAVGGAVCMIGAIVIGIFSPQIKAAFASGEFQNLALTSGHTMGRHFEPTAANAPALIVLCLTALICVVLFAAAAMYGIRIFRHILSPMKEGRPFAGSVSGDLRKLGWLDLILGGGSILGSVILGAAAAKVFTEEVDLSFDLTFLFIAAVLFLCSYIFRYGEMLQQQADETL